MDNLNGGMTVNGSSVQDVKSIEEAFEMLGEILAKMDEPGVTMKLIRYCNETIDTVEKKVQVLSAEGETDEF